MVSKVAREIYKKCEREAEKAFPNQRDDVARLSYQIGMMYGSFDRILYKFENMVNDIMKEMYNESSGVRELRREAAARTSESRTDAGNKGGLCKDGSG